MAREISSKNDGKVFKQMARRFKVRDDNISVVDSRITQAQANKLRELMEIHYIMSVSKNDPKGLQDHDGTFEVVRDDYNRYRVIATGESIVYDEFGTGERGAKHPHPDKDRYNLEPYNSGYFVRDHVDKWGNHYWFWNNNLNYGQPAGMFVFNSINEMSSKGVAREIAASEINKENKKFLNL